MSVDLDHSERPTRLRGYGPIGILAILVIFFASNIFGAGFLVPLGALLVLAWARWSHTPLREIGYSRPRNWIYTVLAGIAIGVVLKLALKALVMPLLGAPAVNFAYQHLAGNTDLITATVWTMLVIGFSEETLWRGFLFERLRRIFGKFGESQAATIIIVVVSSILFGLAHYGNQGLPGVQQSVITGLVFGGIYVFTRNLWLPIVAHSAFDLTAYALILRGLESRVATLFFAG